MARWNPFPDLPAGKPLFITVYITVFAGILISTIFIVSSLYSSPSWLATSPSTPHSSAVDSTALQNNFTNTGEDFLTRAIWEMPPLSEKNPNFASFKLTREMVEYRAKDNVIIVTFGNYAFMDFILNWVKHLTDLNVFNLLVGAMDTKLLVDLYRKGVPVFDMGSNMNTIDVGWGSPTFHKMGREKVFLISALLPFGYELLLCDTDMVWLKEKIDEFGQAIFLAAQNTSGIGEAEKAAIRRMAQLSADGLERLMKEKRLDAVVFPNSEAAPVLAIGGYPGITVPAGYSTKGVPFGICFAGLRGSDPKLIEVAYAFEQATQVRRPPKFT